MKLRCSTTSPFVRKALVAARETGLIDRIETVITNPWAPSTAELVEDNPLGKIPVLIRDDGTTLFDSGVICEYLDSLHGGRKLFLPQGDERWRVLRLAALANGLIEASVERLLESRRPTDRQWANWTERQTARMNRALDALEAAAGGLSAEAPTIAEITAGCALGYLDFRFASDNWREGRPTLARWYERFAQRPSMTATVPFDPPPN